MPQLSRIRLCNIGHAHARIDDLTLALHDADGHPTHSTIWLRNGGGKTMLVSLLLWLICPDKKMPDNRRLEDYVQPHDRSILVAEWQLDSDPRQVMPVPDRYLTGVFCEWRSSSNAPEGTKLRRYFFVTRVLAQEPRLTLDHLPLHIIQSGRKERRTLASFRQEWQDLGNSYPQANVNETEQLSTWRELLEQAGIDPELFGYQILMNRHEAEAEALFKFRESDQFVDFFLELMGNAQLSSTTVQTIETFREALRKQSEQLEPEYHLISTLTQQLTPLRDVARQREQIYHQIQHNKWHLDRMATYLSKRITTVEQDLITTRQQQEFTRNEALRLRRDAAGQRRQAILLRYAAARKCVERLQQEEQELHLRHQQACYDEVVWYAAEPLRKAQRAAAHAKLCLQQQALLQQEHAPLLQQLQESARKYASALDEKKERLRDAEQACNDKAKMFRQQALSTRDQAKQQERQALQLQFEVQSIDTRLKTVHDTRSELERNGTLFPGETWQYAREHWDREQCILQQHQQRLCEAENQMRQEQTRTQQCIQDLEREETRLTRDEEDLSRQLAQAGEYRCRLVEDQHLQHYLEVDEVDAERLDQSAVDQLRHTERAIEDRIVQVKFTLAEHEAITGYLREHHLLPPLRDVERTLAFLRANQLTVWSGWEYLTATTDKNKVRIHLQHMPELAFGIVVHDAHYQQAQDLLRGVSFNLDTPVVILSQQAALDTSSGPLYVIGPSSEAYFDREAGEQELLERQTQYGTNQRILASLLQERETIRQVLASLEQWLRNYSHKWWDEQRTKSVKVAAQQQACQVQLEEYQRQLHNYELQLIELRQQQAKDWENLNAVGKCLERLDAYKPILAVDAEALELDRLHMRGEIEGWNQGAAQSYSRATEAETQEQHWLSLALASANEASAIEHDRSAVRYLEDAPLLPRAGDVQILRDEYTQLVAQYEQRIGANEISIQLKIAQKDEQEELRVFRKRLKPPIDEAAVYATLDEDLDNEEIAHRYHEAVQTNTTAKRSVEDKHKELKEARQALSDTKQRCQQSDIPEQEYEREITTTEEECKRATEEAERQAESFNETAHAQEIMEREATERFQELKNQKQRFEQEHRQIQTLLESYNALFEAASVLTRVVEIEGEAIFQDEEIDPALQVIRQALKDAQKEQQDLNDQSRNTAEQVRSELNRALTNHPQVTLTQKFLDYREEDYERLCNHLLEHLATRKEQIEKDRAEVQQHRELIVQHILDLADKGLGLLKSAMNRSKLPATLLAFEQRPFLKISFKEPPPDERQERIEALLERIIREGKVPSGIELLQQAVRRLASPITVDVLFPDPHATQRYVPIARMAKESGGERLTSTVLLYCTLVQLRAFERTQHAGTSSSLILDNPIGAASHPMLLELQREVAQARKIQLIYTTAVKDFEAIRMFPNIVRVRNDRQDAKSGERLMELDDGEQSLDAMRLLHSVAEQANHSRDSRFQA